MKMLNPNGAVKPTTTATKRPRTTAASTPAALKNFAKPKATGKPPIQRKLNTPANRGQSMATPMVKPALNGVTGKPAVGTAPVQRKPTQPSISGDTMYPLFPETTFKNGGSVKKKSGK